VVLLEQSPSTTARSYIAIEWYNLELFFLSHIKSPFFRYIQSKFEVDLTRNWFFIAFWNHNFNYNHPVYVFLRSTQWTLSFAWNEFISKSPKQYLCKSHEQMLHSSSFMFSSYVLVALKGFENSFKFLLTIIILYWVIFIYVQ